MAQDTSSAGGERRDAVRDIAWRAVWGGSAAALLATLVIGGWALTIGGKGMWWTANAGLACLFLAALVVGYAAKSAEPLNGAYIALIYFAATAAAVIVGDFFGVRPDPLPGLPRGDSTFFFVWPLAQLAAATLGAIAGGRVRGRLDRKKT